MKPTSEQKKGIVSTVAVHLLLLLLLFVLALRTPLPRPGEEGVEIRMGDSDIGTFSETEQAGFVSRAVPAQSQSAEEDIVTQTDEETVAITPRRETTPAPRRENPAGELVRQLEPEPQPVVDNRAIYTGSNRNSDNSGTGTSGTLGRPDGTSSTGGVGEGGQGSGSGIGTGGQGTGYFLQGRGKVALKEPPYNSNEQGRIVVEILVDREGNVVQARAGVRIPNTNPVIGSTISDQKLWEQAEKAAMQSRFSKDDKAAERQKGYIVYNFIKLSD